MTLILRKDMPAHGESSAISPLPEIKKSSRSKMNFTDEQRSIIALNLIPHLGYGQYQKLVSHFGSAKAALEAPGKDIFFVEGISPKAAREISLSRESLDTEKEIAEAEKAGARIITCADADYPEPLKNIADYPPVIYMLGSLNNQDFSSIAIVGTRTPTNYGSSVARNFARAFAESRITCVSGLARGIDSEVHRTCIEYKGRTVAVLGNGLNYHYPPENRKIEPQIAANGALVSEFPMGAFPDKANFPRRNRIIAALALATVVIEAGEKSGSLITARFALEQGKEVFAVPGPIFSKESKGTNGLLKSGALLAESPDDIIDGISPFKKLFKKKKMAEISEPEKIFPADGTEARIMTLLENELNGISIDSITEISGMPSREIASSLMGLELKGKVRSLPGKMYVKSR